MQRDTYLELKKSLDEKNALEPVNLYGVLTVLAEMSFFVAGLVLLLRVQPFGLAYWGLQLLMGMSIFRGSALIHECVHGSLFTRTAFNNVAGTLFSPACLLPYLSYLDVHLMHHKWVGVVDKDPTQRGLLTLKTISPFKSKVFGFVWRFWIPLPFMGYMFNTYWRHPVKTYLSGGDRGVNWKGLASTLFTLLPHVIAIATLGFGRYAVLYGPMFLLYYVQLENMYVPQHQKMFKHLSNNHGQPIPPYEQDAITRSTRLSDFWGLVHGYFHNLHTEHHLFPKAPWYRLPLVKRELGQLSDKTYNEVDFIEYMSEARSHNPTQMYVKALPK